MIALVQQSGVDVVTGANAVLTFGAAVTPGNYLVFVASTNDPGFTVIPSGVSLIANNDNVTDGDNVGIFGKPVISGDGTSYTFTTVGNAKHIWAGEYSGIDVKAPQVIIASNPVTAAVQAMPSGLSGGMPRRNMLVLAACAVRADISAEAVDNSFSVLRVGDGSFSDIAAGRIYKDGKGVQAFTNFSWTTAGNSWTILAAISGVDDPDVVNLLPHPNPVMAFRYSNRMM
jgi:hypothetical protein